MSQPPAPSVAAPRPPPTRRDPVVERLHGVEVADPYRWLEDPDAPDTRAWIAAQNAATEAFLRQGPAREALRRRLEALWDFPRVGLPARRGARWFWFQNDGLQSQAVLYAGTGPYQGGRVLIDPNTLSADGTVSLGEARFSQDGRWVAWSTSDAGSDWRVVRVRDTTTGEDLPDTLRWVKFSEFAWTEDGLGFYYSAYAPPEDPDALEALNHHQELRYHRLGQPQEQDTRVYARSEHPDWGFTPTLTDDGHTLVITSWVGTEPRNRVFVQDLRAPGAPVRPLLVDFDAHWQHIGEDGRWLLFRTDRDAPRGRVLAVHLDEPGRVEERLPQREQALSAVSLVGGVLFSVVLQDACARVFRATPQGEPLGELALPGLGTVAGFGGEPEDTHTYFGFMSFTTPQDVYRCEVATGALERVQASPGGLDPAAVEVHQERATSRDGTAVPCFIVRQAGRPRDGQAPVWLYVYGGFGIPLTPSFSVAYRVWLELGGVVVVANLRGGGEYGQAWHDAGRLANKQNTLDDLHAVAEHLVQTGWTCPARLAIGGRSNGGLTVAAAMIQRPELYGAVLPGVGVLDLLRFHRFTIGWAWISDYGDPADPEHFAWLLRLSPLHTLRPGAAYPPTFITTGDHDDRVVPGHSFKFAAALQHAQGGPAPTLLRVDTRAGHGAGRATAQVIDEWADCWTFLVQVLGVELPAALREPPSPPTPGA